MNRLIQDTGIDYYSVDDAYCNKCIDNNKYYNPFFTSGFGKKPEKSINPEDIIDAEFREKPDTEGTVPSVESESETETEEESEYYLEQVLVRVRHVMAQELEMKNVQTREVREWSQTITYRKSVQYGIGNVNKEKKYTELGNKADVRKRKKGRKKARKNKNKVAVSGRKRKRQRARVLKKKKAFTGKMDKKKRLVNQDKNKKHTYVPRKANFNVEDEEEWWIRLPRKNRKKKKKEKGDKQRLPKRIYFSLRRRVYYLTIKLRDRVFIKKNKKKMRRMFTSLNVATYKQRAFMHSKWVSWLLGNTKYTMDNLNKYAGALATVRATIDRYFYKKLNFANVIIKNTYMNTFLTLMFKGRRVIYQQTAGQLKIYRKIRHKLFVSYVLGRNVVGLFDRLRRRNRFNVVHVDIRGIRLYNMRIHGKLYGYRRYLMKSLNYFNYIFNGLERKKERIIIRIFPKPFKWTNTQQEHYNYIRGQCRYFASRFYNIASTIRRPKKPFNGCRGLELRSERSSSGVK